MESRIRPRQMAVDGVRMGAGQSPRRTCFQPGCFRVGVGGTRREGCVGGTCRELRRGSDCALRIGGASGQSALLLVPAPLPCSPLTPVGMQGFLQPRTVQSRGPPGVTGTRLPDRGQAVWRPAEGARCHRQHQGQRPQQHCRSFVPPPARPRGTKTSAEIGRAHV